MRTRVGVLLTTLGTIAAFTGGTVDLIAGWPGIAVFAGGLVLAAVGLTIWHGSDWTRGGTF